MTNTTNTNTKSTTTWTIAVNGRDMGSYRGATAQDAIVTYQEEHGCEIEVDHSVKLDTESAAV